MKIFPSNHFIYGFVSLTLIGLSNVCFAVGQELNKGITWQEMLQKAYVKHLELIRESLPIHSGMPPIRDLTKSPIKEAERDKKFEEAYDDVLVMGVLKDPGVKGAQDATSTGRVFMDGGGSFAVPAKSAEAIVIAKPVMSDTILSSSHKLVYSRYSLVIERIIKGKHKAQIYPGATPFVTRSGGTIIFPSGHMATFMHNHRGFIEMVRNISFF